MNLNGAEVGVNLEASTSGQTSAYIWWNKRPQESEYSVLLAGMCRARFSCLSRRLPCSLTNSVALRIRDHG